jgi:hypothetical protein
MIGSVLQNVCAAPARREVVYTQTIYRPAPVQYVAPVVQYVQPPPVVQYVQPQVAVQPPPVTETVWIENANGSRTPVELRRADGGRYIGPRGEYYMQYPTMEQLRQVYGL